MDKLTEEFLGYDDASQLEEMEASATVKVMPPGCFAMQSAPKDGTPIEILFRHHNFKYAKSGEKHIWQQWCIARWTNFNGGGWVWHGICGNPICWRYAV